MTEAISLPLLSLPDVVVLPGMVVPIELDVAMAGEVTLNGRVLPIGGVKQKVLAAQRAGITTVFIPKRNEPDLDDVPAEVLDALDVRHVADVGEILAHALEADAGSEVTAHVA